MRKPSEKAQIHERERQIKFRLKEAETNLQFLNEDLDLTESMDEGIASQINQLLNEATTRLRESANLLHMEIRGEKK